MSPLVRLEDSYPVLALRCHELVEASQLYLSEGAAKIAHQSAGLSSTPSHASDYYAKLHAVSELPKIFLSIVAAVWCATDDVSRGLWAIDVIESALDCALIPVAAAAVAAGTTGAGIETCTQTVIDGVRLVAAVAFDTALTLTEK